MTSRRIPPKAILLAQQVTARLPAELQTRLPAGLQKRAGSKLEQSESYRYLLGLMESRYNVDNLTGVSAAEFRLGMDYLSASCIGGGGESNREFQKSASTRVPWRYDHDFGSFQVGPGTQRYRHVSLLSTFMDEFDALPKVLDGKRVLDIGCFLGGPALLLAAMGAEVVAIEEVEKYVEAVSYLRDSFGVTNLAVHNMSLYELTSEEFQDAFDIVLFAGVLYHLSDPVLGMRIVFDAVKPGGTCLLETGASKLEGRVLEYAGKNQERAGVDPHTPSRLGHFRHVSASNWFFPSPLVVTEMMDEVGFTRVRSSLRDSNRKHTRVYAVATKEHQVDMLRAGLSVPNIR
jgi:2-polyprenyl-3-methyl-5-hydroxy-6-metoxy-1,4-benzoquinol methylase